MGLGVGLGIGVWLAFLVLVLATLYYVRHDTGFPDGATSSVSNAPP